MVYEKIKFAGRYEKLHGQTWAQLISVQVLRISGGDRTFEKLIDYDTIREDGTRYRITPGEYILLVFIGSDWIPFTTLRRYTPEKNEYYKRLIGKLMEIEITEEAK